MLYLNLTKVEGLKRSVIMLVLALVSVSSLSAQNDFNLQFLLPDDDFSRLSVCGQPQIHTLRLENISGVVLTDVQLKFDFPNGIFFVPGTLSGAGTEVSSTPAIFSFDEFEVNESVIIEYQLDVNCNGLALALGSSSVNYQVDLCYVGGESEQINNPTPNFEVVNATLSIPNVVGNNSANNIFDASFELIDTVKATIVNGSAGSLESLTYCVDNTHPALNLKEIRIAGAIVPLSFSSVTGDSLYFELGPAEIAQASTFAGNEVQDPDLLQFNESLVICEVWEVIDCPDADMVIPDISRTAYYGCDGTEVCQSTPTSFTGVRFGVLAPQLRAAEYYHHTHFQVDYKDRPYYTDCYNDKEEDLTYSFMFTNNGNANLKLQAFNIKMHASNYYYTPFALDENSVVTFFQDGNTQTPATPLAVSNVVEFQDRLSPTHGYITNCHDGDGSAAWELEFTNQSIIIPPGDTLMIEFDIYHDEENCGSCSDAYSQFNWPYPQVQQIVYNDECEFFDFNELNASVAPRLRQYIRSFTEGNNNFFPGTTNCINWFVTAGENYFLNYYCPNNGQPQVGSSYDDNRYHINSENAWLEDWYILPEGIDWTGVDGDLNTTELTWTDATGTEYPVYDLEYTDHNAGPDTLKVRYQGSGAECFDLRQSSFNLKTIPDCGEGPSFCSKSVSIVKESYYVTECDADGMQCFEEIDIPRPFNATVQSCECNPCEGMVFTYLDLSRQTFGEHDPDNDGIEEAGMLDQTKINKIRFIAGDTIRATYGGWVNLITKPNFEYAYATIDVPVIGSGSTALGDEGITPLGAMVEIWDASTGDMYTCDLVQLFPDGQKVVANLSVQSLKDLNCAGMPADFTYGQDDSISVKFDFRLKDYRSSQTTVNFGSSYYMTDMEYDIGTHYQCNTLSQSMTYIEYRAYNEWVYREIGGCNDGMDNNYNGTSYGSIASVYDSHRNLFRLGSTGFDYFPFEVREIARITQQTYVNNSDLNWGDEFKMLVYDNNGHLTETGGSLSWQRFTLDMNTSPCFAINGNTLVVDFECVYDEVGYERFDEGMDIYCAPTMSPTCQSEYEPPYSLKDVEVYTDYDMLESMFCSPTWTAIDTSIGVNEGIVDPFNNELEPHFMHHRGSIYGGDYLRLVSLPKVQLQPHTVNQLLLEEEACFKVDVSNIGSGPAENVFFTFENQSGAIVFQGVNDGITGDPLDDNLGVINLGSLAVGETRELEFCVTSNNCNRDSILINTGWDCNGLPSTPAEADCTEPVTLYLDIPDAALSMVVKSPDPASIHAVDLCDEVEYVVQISSSDLAAIHDINFQMNLPPGTDFVPGSFELAYPINAGVDTSWVTTPTQPTSSGGSSYNIVLDNENAILAASGLEGTTDLSKNFLLVRFKTFMGCGALSNARMRFLSWAYDPCDEFVNYKFSPGPIVKINGVSDSYVSNLSVPESEELNACEGNSIEVGVNFTLALTSLPTGSSDSIMVELPAGISYVPGSYTVVSNGAPPSGTNPLVVATADGEIVYIDLMDNVMAGETVDVTFEIDAEDVAQSCRDYDLIVRTFNSQMVVCESTGELCDVRTTSDEVTGSVSIVKPDVYISNVTLSAEAAPVDEEILSYCMDLTNDGESIDAGTTTTVELYDDSNDNGDYDAGVDVYLASISTMDAIASGETIEVCGTVNVPSGMTCNVIAIINPATTCACNTNKSYRTNADLTQSFPEMAYEVCSDGSITNIGPEPLDNVSYEWVGIDGASLVGFSSTTTTPVDFQFRNTTGNVLDWKYYLRSTRNDDCATLDTVCITIFPEEHGTVSLQACPFDNFNLSGPTGKTNYQWTPSLGLDNPNAANTDAEASFYPEGVHDFILTYTDENGCPGDFTVEVTIVPCALTYVGNYVWCDDNNNGIQDDDPIEGMTVELFGSTDPTTPIASTVTDANGAYLFGPIPQGEYIVGLDLVGTNYLTAIKNATIDEFDSDLNPNFQTDAFYLSNGDSLTTIDLGILCPEVDIELEKTALTDKDAGLLEAVVLGDTVYWNLRVCNRTLAADSVNFDADSIIVTELLTPGIAYLSHTTNSGSYNPITGLWELDRLVNGSCRSLCIKTKIDQDILPITNTAEITSAKDPDIDSNPDNDDGDQSEDDEDNATIHPKRMDLSLTKMVSTSQMLPVEAGNSVQFTIEVCNQGNVPAYEVQIVDYIPTGMSLDDTNWTAGTGNEVFYSFANPIALNACETMDITLKIDPNFAGDTLTNFAEIAYQAYDDGLYAPDIDSNTDDIPGNDGPVTDQATNNAGGDEDDHDPAGIHLVMVECMASNNGPVCPGTAVTLTETGGNAVSWSWTGPAGFSSNLQSPMVSPAIAGVYTVMVTDENGFEETCETEVSIWAGMALNANQTNVSCQGGNDATIDLMVTGGAAPYTYDWDNDGAEDPDNDNQDLNSLTAGNYSVTVSDANGCTANLSLSITEPTALSCSASAIDALCHDSATGSITSLASGGTAPYEFSLNGGAWQPSGAFTNLAAGNYNIGVRDANLCVSLCNATVDEPELLTCTVTGTDLTDCAVTDGTITASPMGGTAPFTYSIDGGTFGPSGSFSGLMAGSHTITIKDDNDCTTTCSMTLDAPSAPMCSIASQVDIACFDESTGVINVSGLGGETPYEYSINNVDYQASNSFSGLAAGTYNLYIRNASSPMCVSMCATTLSQPTDLICDHITTNVSCFGGDDGSVIIDADGGVTPYEYSLGGPWQPGISFTGLTAGVYTATIRDDNGCTTTCMVSIMEPSALTCTLVSTDALCIGTSTGTITATGAGGVPGYEYSLNNGPWQTSSSFTDLPAGSHSVTIRDSQDCVSSCSVTINEPTALSCTLSKTDLSDCDLQDGVITVMPLGGTAGYTYSIDGGSFGSNATFTGLAAGNHIITTKDANGCETTCEISLTAPTMPICTITSFTDILCFGESTGSLTANATGGNAPYEFSLDDITYQASGTFNGLAAGIHNIYVRNVNSTMCISMCSYELSQPSLLVCDYSQVDVSCKDGDDGSVLINADGGVTPYEYSIGGPWQPGTSFENLSAGDYTVSVRDANNCISQCMITIGEPSILACQFTKVDAACFETSTGSILASATGGTGSYEYNLDNGPWQIDQQFTMLSAGNYVLTVRDENDCTSACNITIGEPALLTCELDGTDLSDCVVQDGEIEVTAAGGTTPYTYSLNGITFVSSNVFTGLMAGAHTITTKDAQGCETTCEFVLSAPEAPICEIEEAINIACKDDATGEITVSASGGVAPYEYSLDNMSYQLSGTFSDLVAGNYTIYVRNVNSPMCITMCTAELSEPLALVCDTKQMDVLCKDGDDGSVIIDAAGGVTPYEYTLDGTWQNAATFEDLAAGNYTATIRDANDCTVTCGFSISEPSLLACSLDHTDVVCNGDGSGSIAANPTGGVPPYEFSLDGGAWQSGPLFSAVVGGTHTVTVRDDHGCLTSCEVDVFEPAALSCEIDYINPESCAFNDGEITIIALGGVSPYEFSIDNGDSYQNDMTFSGLNHGDYIITVRDDNGCVSTCEARVAPACFDLAIEKELVTPAPYSYGQKVVFEIVITNEGNIDASNIELTEHIPCGFTYDPTSLINLANNWTPLSTAFPMTSIATLAQNQSTTRSIELIVEMCADEGAYLNIAEISEAYDGTGDPISDIDSTPDFDPSNDPASEDDHDTALLPIYDPSLVKTLNSTGFTYGDDVTFIIQVCNQIANPIGQIQVVDYLPAGYTFDAAKNSGWSLGAGNMINYTHSSSILAGNDCVDIPLIVRLEMGRDYGDWHNVSEIVSFSDALGTPQDDTDASNDNQLMNDGPMEDNETDNLNNDEDDSDFENIEIVDAALQKYTEDEGPFVFGDTVTYNMVVFNQGNIDLYNININDYLPCGYKFLASNSPQWSITDTIANTSFAGPLAPGDSDTVSIQLEVIACTNFDAWQNKTEISGLQNESGDDISDQDIDSEYDTDPHNDPYEDDVIDNSNGDEDDQDESLVQIFDLALEKRVVPFVRCYFGDTVTFIITVYNQGNVEADNITVLDSLPEGYTFIPSINPDWDGSADPVLAYEIPTSLAPGDSIAFPIRAEIIPSDGGLDVYTNIAEIENATDTSGEAWIDADSFHDHNFSNDRQGETVGTDEDDHDIERIDVVDLALLKTTENDGPYAYGDTILFDIELVNEGNEDLYTIQFFDSIPCGFTYLAENDGLWSYDPVSNKASAEVAGPLEPGESMMVQISLELNYCEEEGAYTNLASLDSMTDEDGVDITHDDKDVDDKDFLDEETIEIFDLALIKEIITPGPFEFGDKVSFKITTLNQGNVPATNIEITDYVPVGYGFDAVDNPGWNSMSAPIYTQVIGDTLAPGEFHCDTIELTIMNSTGGLIAYTNIAEISEAQDTFNMSRLDVDSTADQIFDNDGDAIDDETDDPADEDDHDIASIPVFDLAFIKKAASLGPHMFGDTVTFDFILFNQGNTASTNISLIDYAPCGFEFDAGLNPSWTEDVNGNHSAVYSGTLLAGESDTLIIEYIIKPCATPATAYLNSGEIVRAFDTSGNDMSSQDQDSNYDSTFGNDGSMSDNEIAGIGGDEDDSDIENIAVPAISLEKFLVEIEPSAGMVDHIDVTFELLFKNIGNEDLSDIELIDELDDPLNFGPAYVGIAVGGDPVIVSSTAAVDPTINTMFDGMAAGDPDIFDGTPSLLEPCDSLRVSFIAQLDATLAVDPEMLFNRATVTGQFELADMTTGEVEEEAEVQVLPCISNCEVACETSINVSLNEDCIAVITPAMGGAGIEDYCNYYYDIELFDPWSNPMPNDTVGMDLLGYCVTYTITEPECGNTCSGEACIEYYLPPALTCPSDTIISCAALASIDESVLITEFCAPGMIVQTDESAVDMDCDDPYSSVITRTYVAQDNMGNVSAPCTFSISLERPDLSTIMCPVNMTVGMSNALDCADEIPLDDNGYPVPYDEASGLGTGVPFILDADGMPVNLFPGVANQYCDLAVTYEDMEVPGPNCTVKIMRTWTIIEWDCDGDNEETCTQMIDITDTTGPAITCPDDLTVSTSTSDCRAEISLPMANAIDACNDIHSYVINYATGTLNTNGGDIILNTGSHTIVYSVFDVCGNLSQCEMDIEVQDNIEPTPICEQSIAVSLNSAGYGVAYANSLDQGSFDDCGVASILISRMTDECDNPDNLTFRPIVEFCCADYGTEVMVRLQVTDISGNTNECMVMVEIQDKVAPTMVCLNDTIVECTAIFDIDNLAATFGTPSMSDNCIEEGDLLETIDDQRNDCGIGEIERTLDLLDNGEVVQTCVQIIEVINSDPFSLASITWPLDFESTDVCGLDDLSPDELDAPFDRPVFDEGPCELVGHEYVDQVFEFVEGETACLKVLRTWTLVDWCQQVDGAYLRWEHEQVLKINNTIDPTIISTCMDIVVETADADCASGDVVLELLAEDDCTSHDNLIIEFEIDIDTDGTIDTTGVADEASDEYPVGTHQIYWTVEDGCGNSTTCDYSFQVLSTKTPIPVCEIDQPVFLVPIDIDGDGAFDDEQVVITAEDFDGGSFHPCGYDIDFSFSSDVSFTMITLFCNDLGAFPIELWVTDEEGNQAFCETTIQVIDDNDEDICPAMNMVAVRGNISTETSVDLSNIEVYLDGDTSMNLTDETGDYSFEEMPTGGSYKVRPSYDYDPLNGVSTLDIVIIQRHILGINDLDSPYQLIAADADNSESITAADLLDIRRLILGINDRFTDNTSWRFVDEQEEFIDPTNPWSTGFDEDYPIASLNENMWIDFVGVKVGDVNGSVQNTILEETDTRSNESIDIDYVISGNEVSLIASEDMDLYGLQMHLTDLAKLVNLQTALEDLNMQNIKSKSNDVLLSYAPRSIQSIEKGDVILTLVFESEIADLYRGASIKTECYLGDDLTTRGIRFNEITSQESVVKTFPNPWVQSTTIEFETGVEEAYILSFYNNLGQYEFSTKINAEIGINKVTLKRDYFKDAGIKHYTLKSKSTKMHSGKMFLIE